MPAEMSVRDHFAAAALTGMHASERDGVLCDDLRARWAYASADAMLRERANHSEKPNSSTNHDAAPAARADQSAGGASACGQNGHGTGDTLEPVVRIDGVDHPVSYAGTDAKRVDYDTSREPVAWAVEDERGLQLALHPTPGHARFAARTMSKGDIEGRVVPLYRSPALTDAEREAIWMSGGRREVQFLHPASDPPSTPQVPRKLPRLLSGLQELINRHSAEAGSNTPDYVLADFLDDVRHAFDAAVNERERWHGRANHDAAPAARAEPSSTGPAATLETAGVAGLPRDTAGTGDTREPVVRIDGVDHPVSYAGTDAKRVDYDTSREPVAWAVRDDRGWQMALHPTPEHASHMARTASVGLAEVLPLFCSPALTPEEREAVKGYIVWFPARHPTARHASRAAGADEMSDDDIVEDLRECAADSRASEGDYYADQYATAPEIFDRAADEIARLRLAIRRLADQDATLSMQGGNVTVTTDATLTDAEREAVECTVSGHLRGEHISTLCRLLERTK